MAVILIYMLYFLGVGSLGSAVGKDDVHLNARRRRRIRKGSSPTSVMSKCMKCISGMVVKTGVASVSERKKITLRLYTASLVMPSSYPRDGIFNPNLTTIKDSYNPGRVKIVENLVGYARNSKGDMQDEPQSLFKSWFPTATRGRERTTI